MISILLVDDDKLFVNRIKSMIHWESIGIGTVLTAYSLQQAQEIIKIASVDILLSDIEMPQGSGLELLEWISQNAYPIACIFLSSYAQFSYAQKAIELHSINYLLKPISSSRLEAELRQAVDYVQKSNIKEIFWNEFILYDKKNEEFLLEAQKEGIYSPDTKSYLLLLRIIPLQRKYNDSNLLHFIVSNVTEEIFQKSTLLSLQDIVIKNDHELYLIANESKNEKEEIVKSLEGYAHELEKILDSRIYIYLSNLAWQRGLSNRKSKLEYMLDIVVPGRMAVISESDWLPVKEKSVEFPWEKWKDGNLIEHTLVSTRDEIINLLWQRWEKKEINLSLIRQFRSEFMQMVYNYLESHKISMQMVFEMSEYDINYTKSIESLPDMEEFICYVYKGIIGSGRQDNKNENIVVQMKAYIQNHLGDDLSRKTLASVVYMSEDYVSKIFSEVTGSSLPSYITGRRIEKAKVLLQDTDYPVSKIAMEVGFSNFSYFSKNFRLYVGCTPNEYRNRISSVSNIDIM